MSNKQQLIALIVLVALLAGGIFVFTRGRDSGQVIESGETDDNQMIREPALEIGEIDQSVLELDEGVEGDEKEAKDVLGVEEEIEEDGVVDNEKADSASAPTKDQQYVLFYGETCPYCHDVLDWMTEVNLEAKLDVVTKEVYNNPQFSEQMNLAAKTCGQSRSGVPFLYDAAEKECVVGSTPIIEYLSLAAGM